MPRDDWERSAQAWIESQGDEGDQSRREILDPVVDRLLADVRGVSLLDVGCGEGYLARRLAERGLTVTGLDVDAAAITRARACCRRSNFAPVTVP